MIMEQEYINHAIFQASKSPMETKFGAVLIYRNKIISSGFNSYKTRLSSNIHQCLLRG